MSPSSSSSLGATSRNNRPYVDTSMASKRVVQAQQSPSLLSMATTLNLHSMIQHPEHGGATKPTVGSSWKRRSSSSSSRSNPYHPSSSSSSMSLMELATMPLSCHEFILSMAGSSCCHPQECPHHHILHDDEDDDDESQQSQCRDDFLFSSRRHEHGSRSNSPFSSSRQPQPHQRHADSVFRPMRVERHHCFSSTTTDVVPMSSSSSVSSASTGVAEPPSAAHAAYCCGWEAPNTSSGGSACPKRSSPYWTETKGPLDPLALQLPPRKQAKWDPPEQAQPSQSHPSLIGGQEEGGELRSSSWIHSPHQFRSTMPTTKNLNGVPVVDLLPQLFQDEQEEEEEEYNDQYPESHHMQDEDEDEDDYYQDDSKQDEEDDYSDLLEEDDDDPNNDLNWLLPDYPTLPFPQLSLSPPSLLQIASPRASSSSSTTLHRHRTPKTSNTTGSSVSSPLKYHLQWKTPSSSSSTRRRRTTTQKKKKQQQQQQPRRSTTTTIPWTGSATGIRHTVHP